MEEKINSEFYWKITDNRFVAILKILGLKDWILTSSHEKILSRLQVISNTINNIHKFYERIETKEKDAEVYFANFSDTLVVFTSNNRLANLHYFSFVINWLFQNAIENEIMLKGAMAFGEITLEKENQIYFGQPIVDAFELTKDVNYLGIVAHQSVDEYLRKALIFNPSSVNDLDHIMVEAETPLKKGLRTHRNLKWFVKSENKEKEKSEIIQNITQINQIRDKSSGESLNYLDNTLAFLDKIVNELQ